jgi:transposase
VVDPASIAVPRRRRRAKTDAIDGETLLRTLLAWQRGEPRVCAMVVPPTPEQEDRRRTSRERAVLLQERVRHVNRIKGLLAGQGITDGARAQRRFAADSSFGICQERVTAALSANGSNRP